MAREFEVIERIARALGSNSERVEVGIGDDAAVLRPPTSKLLATVDMMVEGVHFDRAYSRPDEIGRKLLSINVSDIAAMGGIPRFALASLALPRGTADGFLDEFYVGLREQAKRFGVDIVGGNLTSTTGPMALDLTVLGESSRPIGRGGARVGDCVAVTGALGGAAAGLAALQAWGNDARKKAALPVARQLTPEPRVSEGRQIAAWATSMIDISDGLSSELHHLAKASGCGFKLWLEALPVAEDVAEVGAALKKDALAWVLHGGEDYELLFTFAPEHSKTVENWATVIGEVTAADVVLEDEDGKAVPLAAEGWKHQW